MIGGAGSIGRGVVAALLEFAPAALHVVDTNENGLVELTRDLRASRAIPPAIDVQWRCLDFGAPAMERMIRGEAPYDHVLNFAAVKHVRSEKDVFCMLHMLDVNVGTTQARPSCAGRAEFVVVVLFGVDRQGRQPRERHGGLQTPDGARGVLAALQRQRAPDVGALCQRGVFRRQPAARMDTATGEAAALVGALGHTTYFVSMEEAAQLCVIAAFGQTDDAIAVPRLSPEEDLRLLQDVAGDFLRASGFEPAWYTDEQQAFDALKGNSPKEYPVVVTPLDTTGEKAFEEFVGRDQSLHELGLASIEAVKYRVSCEQKTLDDVFRAIEPWSASHA